MMKCPWGTGASPPNHRWVPEFREAVPEGSRASLRGHEDGLGDVVQHLEQEFRVGAGLKIETKSNKATFLRSFNIWSLFQESNII